MNLCPDSVYRERRRAAHGAIFPRRQPTARAENRSPWASESEGLRCSLPARPALAPRRPASWPQRRTPLCLAVPVAACQPHPGHRASHAPGQPGRHALLADRRATGSRDQRPPRGKPAASAQCSRAGAHNPPTARGHRTTGRPRTFDHGTFRRATAAAAPPRRNSAQMCRGFRPRRERHRPRPQGPRTRPTMPIAVNGRPHLRRRPRSFYRDAYPPTACIAPRGERGAAQCQSPPPLEPGLPMRLERMRDPERGAHSSKSVPPRPHLDIDITGTFGLLAAPTPEAPAASAISRPRPSRTRATKDRSRRAGCSAEGQPLVHPGSRRYATSSSLHTSQIGTAHREPGPNQFRRFAPRRRAWPQRRDFEGTSSSPPHRRLARRRGCRARLVDAHGAGIHYEAVASGPTRTSCTEAGARDLCRGACHRDRAPAIKHGRPGDRERRGCQTSGEPLGNRSTSAGAARTVTVRPRRGPASTPPDRAVLQRVTGGHRDTSKVAVSSPMSKESINRCRRLPRRQTRTRRAGSLRGSLSRAHAERPRRPGRSC